jgi:hypothetical protein
MKAIAMSVAIFTGVSSAAVGGATLASTTVAMRHMVKVSGAMRSKVWRMERLGSMNAVNMLWVALIWNGVFHGFSYHG